MHACVHYFAPRHQRGDFASFAWRNAEDLALWTPFTAALYVFQNCLDRKSAVTSALHTRSICPANHAMRWLLGITCCE